MRACGRGQIALSSACVTLMSRISEEQITTCHQNTREPVFTLVLITYCLLSDHSRDTLIKGAYYKHTKIQHTHTEQCFESVCLLPIYCKQQSTPQHGQTVSTPQANNTSRLTNLDQCVATCNCYTHAYSEAVGRGWGFIGRACSWLQGRLQLRERTGIEIRCWKRQ